MIKSLYKIALLSGCLALISCGTELKKEEMADNPHSGTTSLSSSSTLSKSGGKTQNVANGNNTGTSQDSLILSRTPVKLNILKSSPELTHALEALSALKNIAQQELKVVRISDAPAEVIKLRNGRKTATVTKTAGSDKSVELVAKINAGDINVAINLEADTVRMAALAPNQRITVNKTEFGYMLLADNSPIAGVQK